MTKLTLSHVTKNYHQHSVLEDINIEVLAGEMVVIVGPSGCGKTTLLRIIAGLEELSSGEIKINDKVVNKLGPKDRNIAMVFQNYALYPHMTVYHNLAYSLRLRAWTKDKIEERVKKIAHTLGLTAVLQKKPQVLSGGQRQRVAMGRALVREDAIFLFDEPLSNLDTTLRVQMRLEIKQLQRQFRTTSVYVTHDQVEAMTLADRLVVMNNGKIEQIGTPLEIYHHPATKFVAGFMGTPAMNFLAVSIAQDNGLILPGGGKLTHQCALLANHVGEKVYLGIRPENFVLMDEKINQENTLGICVKQVELLGAESLIYGVLSESEELLIVKIPAEKIVKVGTQIKVKVLPKDLYFFDMNTLNCLSYAVLS